MPTQCDNCCSLAVILTTNEKVYGRSYGAWPYIYYCEDCKAAVGCHPNTYIALGRLADRATRQLRSKAHEEFDKLWRTGLMSRDKAYTWLSLQLGIEVEECHISQLSKDQLKDVATLSADYLTQNLKALMRRKVKQDAKQQKRHERTIAAERRTENAGRRRKARR
jgi:hypothetical protein